jgi:hypothetical protein
LPSTVNVVSSDVNPSTPLIVRHVGQVWSAPAVTSYSAESHLQEVLASQPSLLPGVASSPVAVREIQTGAGPLDVLVVDGEGQLTLVECKLASNAQIRREIIGQVLDYASSLWRMSFHDLDARWRHRHPEGIGIIQSLGAEEEEATAVEAALSENLRTGRFNIVLAVDEINDGLRRIVEFLNDRTAPDLSVVAIEMRYARHGDVEILVPTVYGAELARVKAEKAGVSTSWTEDDVHIYLAENWPAAGAIVAQLLDVLRPIPGLTFVGTRAVTPSLIARWESPNGVAWPFVVYTSKTPHVRINFHWMACVSEADKIQLANALSALPGSGINATEVIAKSFKSRPSLSVIDVLAPLAARDTFVGAMHSLMNQAAIT